MLSVEPTKESFTPNCDCCGSPSRTVWGYVHSDHDTSVYYVHWAPGLLAKRGAFWDLVLGAWGETATPADRAGVSLEWRLFESGPQFMVVDAADRPFAKSGLFDIALSRRDVIGKPLAKMAFEIVDAVLAQDSRVAELNGEEVHL